MLLLWLFITFRDTSDLEMISSDQKLAGEICEFCPFCPQKSVSKCSPIGNKVLAVDGRRWNKVRQNHIATRRGVGGKKNKKKTLSARSSGRARHFELQSINVEGSSACHPLHPSTTTTFPNLYDTPNTSEKTAGITLCRRHTFPPRAVVFIRDPLLKAAQEFLMYSNIFATAVA